MNKAHQVATPDRNPHPSVQAWSRGPIFPAVIARVETYLNPEQVVAPERGLFARLWKTEWELIYPGQEPQRYKTYEDAEQQARGLNRARTMVAMAAPYGAGIQEHALRSVYYFDTDRNR